MWMQLRSGHPFDLAAPKPSQVRLDDIVYALARLPRYACHTTKPYFVAEHCCHVHDYLLNGPDYRHALGGLLHDVEEGLIGDLSRPLVEAMPLPWRMEWKRYKANLQSVILRGLNLSHIDLESVEIKTADARILNDERAAVMAPTIRPWGTDDAGESISDWAALQLGVPLGVTIHAWDSATAESEWFKRYYQLTGRRP